MVHAVLDAFFRLHPRPATRKYPAYRGSVLAHPPHGSKASVSLLSASPPFLVELCHRAQKKLVMAVSFNLTVYNDLGLITIPPVIA